MGANRRYDKAELRDAFGAAEFAKYRKIELSSRWTRDISEIERKVRRWIILLCLLPLAPYVAADSREKLPPSLLNEVRFSASLTTAGQPTEEQLGLAADAGFQRVIFLAFNDHKNALSNEDRLVKSLGLEFFHIPVVWNAPTISDFDNFAALMLSSKKTLVHCEVNFRASVFGFLYEVIYRGMPADEAYSLLTSIWIPNRIWRAYIITVLADKGIAYPAM